MAIRVTKAGVHPNQDVFAGTCRTCHTEVEFDRSDAHRTFNQRDGDYLTVKCPTCREDINVNASKPLRKAEAR